MADFSSALVARLIADPDVSAITARVHWTKVPQAAALPYVRLQVVSDPRPQHLSDYDNARTVRVQADAFAEEYSAARALATALIAAVAQPGVAGGVLFGRGKATGPRDLGEDTPAGFVHRLSTDLFIEHTVI